MFTKDNIVEGMLARPQVIEINQSTIKKILHDAGIKSKIQRIDQPHPWIMQSQRIYLNDGRCLMLKVAINPNWTDASAILNQVKATEILRSIGIEQPNILAYSTSPDDYEFMFILIESQKGIRLSEHYKSKKERLELYKALGRTYSRIHSIKNDWAGIWNGDPRIQKYPIHPAEFYLNAEIYNGSTKYLMEKNIITNTLYDQICDVWKNHLEYLKQRPNTLVHVSPFPWSIYLQQRESQYTVSGVGAIADFMWWDPMVDVTHILYPPYLDINEKERNIFLEEYGLSIDEQAINLYKLLHRLCAMSGCYLAPVENSHADEWIKKEVKTISRLLDKLK